MPVKFRKERFDEWFGEAHKSLLEHAETIDWDVDPNFDQYIELEHNGVLHIITGRNEKNELVAYWMGFIFPHPQNKKVLSAFDDVYWVRKDYRGITVLRLYKFLESYYDELGVNRSYHLVRPDLNRLGQIIEKLGYKKSEEMYLKVR